jgi:hypothetical protein
MIARLSAGTRAAEAARVASSFSLSDIDLHLQSEFDHGDRESGSLKVFNFAISAQAHADKKS